MTINRYRDQANRRGRAAWLARLAAGRSQKDERHDDRRCNANKLARARSADVIGEFLIGACGDEGLTDSAWSEVLGFIRYLRADLLVVICPEEIAPASVDYYRRAEMLNAAGIELAVWAVDCVQESIAESPAA